MTRARLGVLGALIVLPGAFAGVAPAAAQDRIARQAFVIYVPGASFEDVLGVAEVVALAGSGGAALMSTPVPVDELVRDGIEDSRVSESEATLAGLGDEVTRVLGLAPGDDVLVIVVGTERSEQMAADKDELLPAVVARGDPAELMSSQGEPRALTSDSTRRVGVVVGDDVVTTLVEYLGLPIGGEDGSRIRTTSEPAPFELHDRYLAQRRMYVPVGTAAALYVTGAGLAGIGCLAGRRRVPSTWRRAAAWACLSVPMLATGLLAVGHLTDLSYATAVPMISIVAVLGTMAFSPLERRDATLVPAGIGVAVLAAFVVEWLVGWTGLLTPLLGGSQLDGGRFYGLPNVAIGLLVGSGLWVAQRLPAGHGLALLCGIGLFAGLPMAGANLGAAVTAFAAAGLWIAVRERDRLGVWRGLGVAALVTVVGTAAILVAHAVSPVATHVSRFEERVTGIAGVLDTFADRLKVGFDLIARSPAAIVPVLGLPAVLVVVLRPPEVLRRTFELHPAWRDAVLVTILAGMVAYVANDSGPAAAGLAFGLGLGGMLGVSLLSLDGKMVEP